MTDTEMRNTNDLRDASDSVMSWDHETMGPNWTWHPTPPAMGGESVYASAFCSGERAGLQAYITVPYTMWGDYSGSTVERSNCRSIREDYPEYVVHVRGDYSSEWLVLPLGVDIPAVLFDGILALSDHPRWCDEDHSMLEMELADEAWDYHARDLRDDILAAIVGPNGNTHDADDLVPEDGMLYDLYRLAAEALNVYPFCEDAVSAVLWTSHDPIGEWIADHIMGEWAHRPELAGQLSLMEV